jgi:hypothetical protein
VRAKPKMRKPPLAHCNFSGGETAITASVPTHESVSVKMYFNQKIIVINNCWGAWWRRHFRTNNECLFTRGQSQCCFFTSLLLFLERGVRRVCELVGLDCGSTDFKNKHSR